MAFSDPQSIKIGEATTSLPRVSTGEYKSKYASEDRLKSLEISTQETRERIRQVYRINSSKITADAFDTTQNVEAGMSAYLVVDRPKAGFTNAEAKDVVKGLLESLSASTYAAVVKLLASES